MALDKGIKVIKRDQRPGNTQTARFEVRQVLAQHYADIAKNNAATIVTRWVYELRQRKGEDAHHKFESLFRTVS